MWESNEVGVPCIGVIHAGAIDVTTIVLDSFEDDVGMSIGDEAIFGKEKSWLPSKCSSFVGWISLDCNIFEICCSTDAENFQ